MIWHIFKKDMRALWPLALLVLVLQGYCGWAGTMGNHWLYGAVGVEAAMWLRLSPIFLLPLASALLIILAVQQEALVGLTQDWLIRPLRRRDVFLAKVAFVVLTIGGSSLAVELTCGLSQGFPLLPTILDDLANAVILILRFGAPMFVLAVLSRSLLGAIITALVGGAALGGLALGQLWMTNGSLPELKTALDWVQILAHSLQLLSLFALIVWLQYWRRSLPWARTAFLAACVMAIFFPKLPWPTMFALQSALSAQPAADQALSMAFWPAAGRLGQWSGDDVAASQTHPDALRTLDEPYSSSKQRGFANVYLPLRISGLPANTAMVADSVVVRLKDKNGNVLVQLLGKRFDLGVQHGGEALLRQGLFISKDAMARWGKLPLRAEIDYSLTLLHAQPIQSMPVSGPARMLSEVGLCTSTYKGGSVSVNCIEATNRVPCLEVRMVRPSGSLRSDSLNACELDYAPYPGRLMPLTAKLIYGDETQVAFFNSSWSRQGQERLGSMEFTRQAEQSRLEFRVFHPVDHFMRHVVIQDLRLAEWKVDSRGAGYVDGVTSAARFNHPLSVTVDAHDAIYIADSENAALRKIAVDGTVTTLVNIPRHADLVVPAAMALDQSGSLWALNPGDGTLAKVTPNGQLSVFGKPGQGCKSNETTYCTANNLALGSDGRMLGFGHISGVSDKSFFWLSPSGELSRWNTALPVNAVFGVAIDASHHIYAATASGEVFQINADGTAPHALPGFLPSTGRADESGTRFDGFAMDAGGNRYISSVSRQVVYKITPTGVVSILAGSLDHAGYADGGGNSAMFDQPAGLVVDHQGNVLVADAGNNNIRKISPEGMVSTVAGWHGYGTPPALNSPQIYSDPQQ